MRALDASSAIFAWDNYPKDQFEGLWTWIAAQIGSGNLVISQIAYEEVQHKLPPCAQWLHAQDIVKQPPNQNVLRYSMAIQKKLGIDQFAQRPPGVNENDVLIIATAQAYGTILISEESRQPNLPKRKDQYKIPAVCALPGVGVQCIRFVDYFKDSKAKF